MIFQVGRLAVKIAGRDAGRKCIVVESVDDQFVIVDGNVRRKRVNVKHLEPLTETLDIKDKASHEDVKKAFEKAGFAVWDKKSKKATERPRKVRGVKKAKKVDKKEAKPVEAEKKEEKAPEVEEKPVEEPKAEPAPETKEPKTEEPSQADKPVDKA